SAVFKTAAFSHSASPPIFHCRRLDSGVHDTGIACAVNALHKTDRIFQHYGLLMESAAQILVVND
nr:hypothetical protein [Oleiphilaceae bacterium]